MDWSGTGILLSARPHGEHAAILEVFTPDHGRYLGVLHGGQSRRKAPMLQPGNQLALHWRARLSDHMGSFSVELERDRAASLMSDRMRLAGLSALTGVLAYALPERQALPRLYETSAHLLEVMALTPAWTLMYLQWELLLLRELGFGLDLSACAATGINDELIYVSPRTGRAVSRHGAGDWADRMLPLPPCLKGEGSAPNPEIALALSTTGHFLHKHLHGQWNGSRFRRPVRDCLTCWSGQNEPAA